MYKEETIGLTLFQDINYQKHHDRIQPCIKFYDGYLETFQWALEQFPRHILNHFKCVTNWIISKDLYQQNISGKHGMHKNETVPLITTWWCNKYYPVITITLLNIH